MGTLFELLSSLGMLLFSSMKDVTKKEIEKNIKFLGKYQWFQEYHDIEKYKKLIYENEDVRHIIGKFNTDKMDNNFYRNRYKKKITKILLGKSSRSA